MPPEWPSNVIGYRPPVDPRDAEIAKLREHINYLETWKGMTENHDPYTAAHATLRLEIDRLRSLLGEAAKRLQAASEELESDSLSYDCMDLAARLRKESGE